MLNKIFKWVEGYLQIKVVRLEITLLLDINNFSTFI